MRNPRKGGRRLIKVGKYLFLGVVAIFVIMPIAYTISSSFKTNAEIMAHPEHFWPEVPTL